MAKTQTAPPTRRQQQTPPRAPQRAQVPATTKKETREAGQMPAYLANKGGSGRGLSQDASDNLIPLIYILQPLSPQVMARNPAQIPGAEPGDIWLRNAADPVHKEIWFQPCHFWKDWVEWIPRSRGGGYAGRHDGTGQGGDSPPVGAKEYRDPENPQSIKWRLPNGNDVVQTRYYGGNVWLPDTSEPLPYIIALSSTGHTFGKAWMVTQNQRRNQNGEKADAFSTLYHLITTPKSNNKGEWYMFEVDDMEWATEEQFDSGEALAASFESKEKRAETPMGPETSDVAGAGADNQGRM